MAGVRSRYGLFVSAVGAIVLAASLVTPWYGVGTGSHPHPAALAGHALAGTPAGHALAGTPAGHALAGTVDAFHALPGMTVVLLVLGALAMLDITAPLVRTDGPLPGGAGGSLVLLGVVAGAFTVYHMIDLPALGGGTFATSLQEGAWLALIGSVTMVLGGMWPRCVTGGEARHMQPGTLSWN
jgi:hypothetical protein